MCWRFLSSIEDFSTLYHKGLGRVYERKTRMDRYDMRELLGYIKGADTVGSTPNITIYNEVREPLKTEFVIKLLQNPTNDYLKVHYQNQETRGKLNFSIVDIRGQILSSYEEIGESDQTYTFSVKNLVSGIYFLEIRQNGDLFVIMSIK